MFDERYLKGQYPKRNKESRGLSVNIHPGDPITCINSKDSKLMSRSILMSMSKHPGSTRSESWSKGFGRRDVSNPWISS